MKDSQIIEEIVKKYYGFLDVENTRYSMIFHIEGAENEKTFISLLDDLDKVGFTAFTNDFPDNQIIVINNTNLGRERTGIKTLMFLISIITLVYTGYIYSSNYYSIGSLRTGIFYGVLVYAVPVMGILLIREVGKYISLRKNHIKDRFPIFVPAPGLGTLGIINSNKSQFRESKSMVRAGTVSLLSGFIVSISLIMIGSYTSTIIQYSAAVNSPVSALNFPVIYPVILEHFIPASLVPPPLALAGYTGLITTALNAMPIGFLDGGIVFSAILGRRFKYVSYVAMILLILASILYPYILILVILLFILGIRGALPLNNLVKPGHYIKYLAIIVILIILFGFAPLPIHNLNNSSVAISDTCYVMNKQDPANVTVNITVNEKGINVIPVFTVHPGKFKIEAHKRENSTTVLYMLDLITYKLNYSGLQHFNITVNTGTHIFRTMIKVFFVNPMKNIGVNNSTNPFNLNASQDKPFNLTLYNNGSTPMIVNITSISSNMKVYAIIHKNLNSSLSMASTMNIIIPAHSNESIEVEAQTPGIWQLIIYESSNPTPLMITIHILPKQKSPPVINSLDNSIWAPFLNPLNITF